MGPRARRRALLLDGVDACDMIRKYCVTWARPCRACKVIGSWNGFACLGFNGHVPVGPEQTLLVQSLKRVRQLCLHLILLFSISMSRIASQGRPAQCLQQSEAVP